MSPTVSINYPSSAANSANLFSEFRKFGKFLEIFWKFRSKQLIGEQQNNWFSWQLSIIENLLKKFSKVWKNFESRSNLMRFEVEKFSGKSNEKLRSPLEINVYCEMIDEFY